MIQFEKFGWKYVKKENTYYKNTGVYDPEDDITGVEYKLKYNGDKILIEHAMINFGKADYPYEGHDYLYVGLCRNEEEFKLIQELIQI